MSETVPLRGHVYEADLTGKGPQAWLVVSNDARNRALGDCLVARIVTALKPELPSVVELGLADPYVGRVVCDALGTMYRDEILCDLGELTVQTMTRVETALKHALGL